MPLVVVEEIRRLLDEAELSQRKIADKLGVSRGTVGAISNGQRGIYGREHDPHEPDLCNLNLPPERCPGCGGMVYVPCLLCRARRYAKRHKRLRQIAVGGEHQRGRRVA